MKNWSELEGSSQNEALLNELKGNLFEYLVGSLCARHLGIESKFVSDFDRQAGGESKKVLLGYQEWLRKADQSLYLRLPALAKAALDFTLEETPLLSERPWRQIIVVGKSASGMGDDSLAESDLLFIDDAGKKLGLSLKFVKKNAFINTKSGGIRSYISKYFSSFKNAASRQESLNEALDFSFARMLNELYLLKDLDCPTALASERSINPVWVQRGFPELPGQLDAEAKAVVHAHYYRLSQELENIMSEFFHEDRSLFIKCLFPLLGFGFNEIRQLSCFHDDSYKKAHFHYETFQSIEDSINELKFLSPSEDKLKKMKSGFEMEFGSRVLQIRLKPMNKFTVSGLKVNCSVKVKQ